MEGKEKLLICRPITGGGEPAVPSDKDLCAACLTPIWRARSSPKEVEKAICMNCFIKLGPENLEFMGPSPEQEAQIKAYYEEHPDQKPEGNKPLCVVIERLCTSLRDLRATAPGSFYGQPVERLYKSLEAALDSFYRAEVESTSPDAPNDPEALQPPW